LVNTKNYNFLWAIGWFKREVVEWGFHPLIYIFPTRNLAQDVEKKKAEPMTPHFFSLDQDIVTWSQDEKCALNYDM
jgi:hypothetical protein